jgi:hypothetical protein
MPHTNTASLRTPTYLQRFFGCRQLQWYKLKRCEGSKRVYQLGGETETNLVAEGLLWTGSPIARPRDRRKIRFEGPHA